MLAATRGSRQRTALLKQRLDELYRSYDKNYLYSDPLQFPHKYDGGKDKEVVAFISATLAYGSVVTIKRDVERVLSVLGENPHHALLTRKPEELLRPLGTFKHRFTTGRHMAWLLTVMGRTLAEFGSLKGAFLRAYTGQAPTIRHSLISFVEGLVGLDPRPLYPNAEALKEDGALFLLPSPRSGAACKRLNLFLRWVVRTADDLDLGLWPEVGASKLVIPLDTHIARISRAIGLTERKSSDWKAAEDITNSLRKLDPEDPLKYDFSLTRLGILGNCVADKQSSRCGECSLAELCIRATGG